MKSNPKTYDIVSYTLILILMTTPLFAADIDSNGNVPIHIGESGSTKVVTITTDGAKERLDVNAAIVQDLDKEFRPGTFVSRHLSLSGSFEMNVDGSTVSKDFTVVPSTDKVFYVARLIMILRDENINHLKFGGITGGITNGIQVKATENGTERAIHEEMIKFNAEFNHLAYDVTIVSSATDMLTMRWSFFKSGTYIKLEDATSDKIKVTIQDDLTSLLRFQMLVQGFEVDE